MLLTGQAGIRARRPAGGRVLPLYLGVRARLPAAERALLMAVFADRQVICSNGMVRWSR